MIKKTFELSLLTEDTDYPENAESLMDLFGITQDRADEILNKEIALMKEFQEGPDAPFNSMQRLMQEIAKDTFTISDLLVLIWMGWHHNYDKLTNPLDKHTLKSVVREGLKHKKDKNHRKASAEVFVQDSTNRQAVLDEDATEDSADSSKAATVPEEEKKE